MPYDEKQTMVVRITSEAAAEHGALGDEVRLPKIVAMTLLDNNWCDRTARREPPKRASTMLPERKIDPGSRAAGAPAKEASKGKTAKQTKAS